MNGLRRFFTLILTICMVLNMMPFGVFAEEADAPESTGESTAATEAPQETADPTEVQQETIAPAEAPEDTTAPTEVPEEILVYTLPKAYAAPAGSTVSGEPFDTSISKNHRIPGLVILNDGTLVASADARWDAEKDGGGLDIVVSRSSDLGTNWSYSFAAYLGDNGNVYNANSSTLIDPLLITDGSNLYLLSDLFPAGYSLGNWNTTNAFSDSGIGFDEQGRLILSNDEYASFGYYLENGKIYSTDGAEVEGCTVDGWFNLYQDNSLISNLFYADSSFKVRPTSYISLQTYENGSWSEPELLNIKPQGVSWQVLGPGSGIVTADGKLAFTAYDGSGIYLVYGSSGNWQTVRTAAAANESSIVELSDGTIRAFVKNSNNTVCYVDFAKTADGYTAGELQNTGVPNTGWCMVSSMKYSGLIGGKEAIFVCCPSRGDGYRYDGKIHVFLLNEDNSMELLTSYQVNDAFFAYSDMAELPGGESIALLYEDGCLSYDGTAQGVGYSHISFEILPVSTIIPGIGDTEDPTEPSEGEEETEPTEPTDPTESTEPTEPVDQTVTDEATNITVTAPGVQGVTVAVAEESSPAEGYDVSVTYSIDLTDTDGNPYNGSATLVIPVPDSLRNAAAYTGSVDGTPVEVPMPVGGFFTIEMPHFSDLTISADLKEVNIELFVGQTYVVDDPTGNYAGNITANPGSQVTMTVTGKDATTEKGLQTVTSTDSFDTARSFLLENQRAGELLTDTAYQHPTWNPGTGLLVDGKEETTSDDIWTISPVAGGYALEQNGKYLTIAPGTATMQDSAQALTLEYIDGGYWLIYANCTDTDSKNYNFYLSDVSGSEWDGALPYKEAGEDDGHRWLIHEIVDVDVPASTQITFEAESAGITQAVIGNVTYNITVAEYQIVDVELYAGYSKTLIIDESQYTGTDIFTQPDTSKAAIDSITPFAGTSTYSVSDIPATTLEAGASYLICLDGTKTTVTTNENSYSEWNTTVLRMENNGLSPNSSNIWTLEAADGGYKIKTLSNKYMCLSANTNTGKLESTGEVFEITWDDSAAAWIIGTTPSEMYLNNLGNSNTSAGGWTGDGSKWELYKVTSLTSGGYTEVKFTGVAAGKTTATVGHVIYNITVKDTVDGEIAEFNNITGEDVHSASNTTDTLDMSTKKVTKLTITENTTFHLGVDVDDYDSVAWSVQDDTIAEVDADGNVTGLMAGNTTVTATVVKNGVRESITADVCVKDAMVRGTENAVPMFFYIEQCQNTTPYYTIYLYRNGATDAPDGFKLQKVQEGEVIYIERPAYFYFCAMWFAAPDENFALAYMKSTGSHGDYNPLKNSAGNLGGVGLSGDDPNATYFCKTELYKNALNQSTDTAWKNNVRGMVNTAVSDSYGCEGGQGFTRAKDSAQDLMTAMSFIAEPLPKVSKVVNGILPVSADYNEDDPNSVKYLRKDFKPYQEGMIASVDGLIYYTITVTIPRPLVWQMDSTTRGAIVYTNAWLRDFIDNDNDDVADVDKNNQPLSARFYVQSVDNNPFDGTLSDKEIEAVLDKTVFDPDDYNDDLTMREITDELNAEWRADETSRTLEFYVVYKIREEDIPGNTIKNKVKFTYSYKTTYASGTTEGSAVDNAVITVTGTPIDDIVIDFGLPVTITGLYSAHGVNLADTFASSNNSRIELSTPYTMKDENGNTIVDNYNEPIQFYDLTYIPTQILQGPDVVTLIDTDDEVVENKIVNGFVVYPATTVFYEEGFAAFPEKMVNGSQVPGFEGGSRGNVSQEVQLIGREGANYGYNSAYVGNLAASSGDAASSDQGNDQATFCFTGTGVDIYANCSADSGDVLLQIRNHDTNQLVQFSRIITKTGTGSTPATSMQGGDNYSLPVYSVTDLPFGTYDVVIQHSGLATGAPVVSLDGIRVYNTLMNLTNTVVYPSSEQNPTFVELRDYILAAYDVSRVTDSSQYKTASNAIIEMVYDQDDRGTGVFLLSNLGTEDNTTSNELLVDLLDNGPKNEIYLGPGMSVTFTLNDGVSAQIGLKEIKGLGTTCTIGDNNGNTSDTTLTLNSTIDMFYDLPAGTVVIQNTGGGVLAITKLKVFGNSGLDDIFKPVTTANVSFSLLRMASITTLDEPVITRQPVDTAAALNQDMAVSLNAEGENLRYQWYWRNASDTEFQVSSCKTDTYYTTMTKVRDGREIYCVITDAQGNQIMSDTVTLSRIASTGLRIVTQPVNSRAALNEDMAISLKANGESLKYQWYWRDAGKEEFQKSSCKTDTYYTTMTKARDGREIYCVVTDAVGNQVVSRTVTLRRVAATKLAIVSQPVDSDAVLNEDMAVSLAAEGEELKYQWYWRDAGKEEFQKSSCKTDTYYTTMTKARNGREIYCVVTDGLGNQVTSDTVTLRRVAAVELQIAAQPTDTTAVLNEAMAISLEAQGEELKYQWYWRDAGAEVFQKSSCKTDTYYTTMTKARDGREIFCVITDALGNQIASHTVTLRRVAAVELQIVTQPADAVAVLNEDMAIGLEAQGEELKYQWYWRDAGAEVFQKSSCKTDTYYTTMTKARDGREIYCVITDGLGNQVISEIVTMRRVAETQLQIVQQPVNASAALNEDMAISLTAEGEGVKYQWYWRNAGDEMFQISSCRTDTYYTTMTKVRDGREIYCVITDDMGNQTVSETVTLTMDR